MKTNYSVTGSMVLETKEVVFFNCWMTGLDKMVVDNIYWI